MMKIIPAILTALLASGTAFAQSTPAVTSREQTEVVAEHVEQHPQFKGNVAQFISDNLVYPASALRKNQSGKVYIQFIVRESGAVDSAHIRKSSGYEALDNEALRVVNAMNPPDGTKMWNPATNGGQPVKFYFSLPIVFSLSK